MLSTCTNLGFLGLHPEGGKSVTLLRQLSLGKLLLLQSQKAFVFWNGVWCTLFGDVPARNQTSNLLADSRTLTAMVLEAAQSQRRDIFQALHQAWGELVEAFYAFPKLSVKLSFLNLKASPWLTNYILLSPIEFQCLQINWN